MVRATILVIAFLFAAGCTAKAPPATKASAPAKKTSAPTKKQNVRTEKASAPARKTRTPTWYARYPFSRNDEGYIRTADGSDLMYVREWEAIPVADLAVNFSDIPGSRLTESQERSIEMIGWKQSVRFGPGWGTHAAVQGWNGPVVFGANYSHFWKKKDSLERWMRRDAGDSSFRYKFSFLIEKEDRHGWIHLVTVGLKTCIYAQLAILSNRKLTHKFKTKRHDTLVSIKDCTETRSVVQFIKFLESVRKVPRGYNQPPLS